MVEALPEDAQCVHHEGNTATAICEGTGDYICALCSIDVGGRTYSAQFLENAGSDFAKQSFDRFLPRPDTTVLIFILLYFVPYVNSCWVFGTVVWLPLGYMKLVQANRLRYRNPIYHRVVGPTRIVLLAVFLTLIPGMILATWFVIAWLMLNTFNDF